MIRKGQDRLKTVIPGGGGGNGLWIGALTVLVALWGYYSVYRVDTEENGVVLRLGSYQRTVGPGLHLAPWPFETLEKVPVSAENQDDFGGRGKGEGLMLAGDQNIVDVQFTVLWRVRDPNDFLFNITDQRQMVRVVAESAMREVVGRTSAELVRTRGREAVQEQVQALLQSTLDSYQSGIAITSVQLKDAAPPPQVFDAFEEVQRAEQNQNRFIREAEQYRNQILGQARGEASKVVEDAKGYRARVTAAATGEAQRFVKVYDEYAKAKDVTRKRLFLETMEGVLSKTNKVIIEGGGETGGVVPYLPLPEVQRRSQTQNRAGGTGGQ